MQSTAIVFPAPFRVEIQSYELPQLRLDEILVKTEFSGLSQGTEMWAYTGKRPELVFPTVPGYQSVSLIEAVGSETDFKIGQRVLFTTSRLPDSFPETWMGGHVSHALVKIGGNHPPVLVPAEADPVAAALAPLPAVSLRGLNKLKIGIGDLVVVTGQGLIGQSSAQLARLRGATVVATDVSAARLKLSAEISADEVVNVQSEDLVGKVRALKPDGADCIIETTGRADQFAPGVDLLRPEGQILLQGYYPAPICFDFHATHLKQPTIFITCGFGTEEVKGCLDLMRAPKNGGNAKLRMRELVTDLVPVEDAPATYERLAKGDNDVLGVVFRWNETSK